MTNAGQILDAIRHACAAYAQAEMRRRLNHYDDKLLDELEDEQFEQTKNVRKVLKDAGIEPIILAEILS